MPEASVSSIGSLGPVDFARVGVGAKRVKTESMTLCLPSVLGQVDVAKKLWGLNGRNELDESQL